MSGDLFSSQSSIKDRYTRDELVRMFDELDGLAARGHALTKWELDFLHSVREQLEDRGRLTDRQVEKLDAIRARCRS